jgi:hypothetical protein
MSKYPFFSIVPIISSLHFLPLPHPPYLLFFAPQPFLFVLRSAFASVGVWCCLLIVCVAGLGFSQAKALLTFLSVAMVTVFLERHFPYWGHHCRTL